MKYESKLSLMRISLISETGTPEGERYLFSAVADFSKLSDKQQAIGDICMTALLNRAPVVRMDDQRIPGKFILSIGSPDITAQKTEANQPAVSKYFILPDSLIYTADDADNIWNDPFFMPIIESALTMAGYTVNDAKLILSTQEVRDAYMEYYYGNKEMTFERTSEAMNVVRRYLNYFNLAYTTLLLNNEAEITKDILNKEATKLDQTEYNKMKKTLETQQQRVSSSLYVLGKDLESLENTTDAFNQYFNNPTGNIRKTLNDVAKNNYKEAYCRYHTIYPRFKVFFREEDARELLMMDELYGFSDIVSIEIAAERGTATKTARVVLSNALGRLTDIDAPTLESVSASDLKGEQQLTSLNIEAGTTIIIVGGYENYIHDNPIFIGKIVELYPGPQLTIVAQSFGAELLGVPFADEPKELTLADGFGDYGDVAQEVLTRVNAFHFGNDGLAGFGKFYSDSADIKHQNIFLRLVGDDYKVWNFDNNRDLNVYLPKTQHMRANYGTSVSKSWWITPDQTAWDVLNELTLYKRDFTVTTRVFNKNNFAVARETLYLGPKNGYYLNGDIAAYKYNLLKDSLYPNSSLLTLKNMAVFEEDKGTRSGIFKSIVNITNLAHQQFKESDISMEGMYASRSDIYDPSHEKELIKEIVMKETIAGAADINNGGDGNIANWVVSADENYSNDEATIQEACANTAKNISNNAFSFLSPVRDTHFISTSMNIIANNLIVNATFNNKVVMQFPKEQPHYDMRKVASTVPVGTFLKNKLFGTGSGLETQEFTMDDNIKPENIREYVTYQKNIDTDVAECGANKFRYILKREVDSLVDYADSYDEDYVKARLQEVANNSYSRSAIGARTYVIGRNPFNYPQSYFTTKEIIEQTNMQDARIIGKLENRYIQTSRGAISAKDYYNKLIKLGVSHQQALALLHIANVRHPVWYTVGRNILANQAKGMYDGTITLIGDMSIKEGDRCVLYDLVNNMHGVFDVRAVVHSYSIDNGFTTTVTPDLITYVNDRRDVFDGALLVQIAKNRVTAGAYKTAQTISTIGAGGASLAGGIVSGIVLSTSLAVTLPIAAGLFAVGAAIGYGMARHEINKISDKEAKTVYGRHAIGFMPLLKSGVPYTGGIGGYRKTPYADIQLEKALTIKGEKLRGVDL